MPANHRIDIESRLIITTWEGDAVDTDFIEALIEYQKEIQLNSKYASYNEIADFTKITSIRVTPKGLVYISRVAAETDSLKLDCKLALIVNNGVAFNLARIYSTYRNMNKNSKKEVRIFNDINAALDWAKRSEKAFSQL